MILDALRKLGLFSIAVGIFCVSFIPEYPYYFYALGGGQLLCSLVFYIQKETDLVYFNLLLTAMLAVGLARDYGLLG